MGPLALFDKSFLQSLNQNEAALFDVLFRTNICPIFYMETLADLTKENSRNTPEVEVGIIASKTPEWGSCVNASHITMCAGELMGHSVELAQIPALAGGRQVEVEGKTGMYYVPSREQQAFGRWQAGRFEEVERLIAKEWRDVLKQPQIDPIRSGLKFRDLSEIRAFTKEILATPQHKWMAFNGGIITAGFDQREMWKAIKLWCSEGLPLVAEYAPYVDHLAQVNTFFSTAVLTGHISADRASNKIDAAYLYYLPFTQIFISSDNLHSRMTPHFLASGQKFVSGADLKQDLRRLVDVFKVHPDIDKLGLVKIASCPPKEDSGLIAQLYDSFIPSWRQRSEISAEKVNSDPEQHAKIMRQVEEMKAAAKKPMRQALPKGFDRENMEMLTIERRVSMRRGDWQFLPPNLKE